MIVIHAYLKVKPDQRGIFLDLANQVISNSKAEAENISYQLFEDTEQENAFVFLEVWKDEAAIENHEETPHFNCFRKEIPQVLLEPIRVEKYKVTEKM